MAPAPLAGLGSLSCLSLSLYMKRDFIEWEFARQWPLAGRFGCDPPVVLDPALFGVPAGVSFAVWPGRLTRERPVGQAAVPVAAATPQAIAA